MIRAVIIEDEDFAVERLQMILGEINEPIEIVAVLNSIKESVRWLSANESDLIFLDINLADGNAFKIFEQIEVRTPIIFTTAYHEYALRAFEQHSIDYLLKPVNRDRLKSALNKLTHLKKSDRIEPSSNLQELVKFMQLQNTEKRFMVNVGNKVKLIKSSEVVYFVSDSKITFLQTADDRRYPIDLSLKQLELSLPDQDFFRVNRQYLVSRKPIKELQYSPAAQVKLILDPPSKEDIIVARDRVGMFKRWLA